MQPRRIWLQLWLVMLFVLPGLQMQQPVLADTRYRTGFTYWRAAERMFDGWQRDGVLVAADGSLQIDSANAHQGSDPYPAGSYNGRNFYNGGAYIVGEAISPVTPADFGYSEAIASWNAGTPAGTWIETQIRAQIGQHWTKWYNLGVWAADTSTVKRHSVKAQGDADGSVAVDTLKLTAAANGLQLKIRLFARQSGLSPTLHNVAVTISTTPVRPAAVSAGDPALWNKTITIPQCSQMVYPDGGEVWCSPTSTSMVLGYWDKDGGPCSPRVHAAVDGVFDWTFGEHGNWPFNTAYASTHGLEGFVMRFSSLAQAEPWIAAGVPVVMSMAWNTGQLSGAPIQQTDGHLMVLVGFDAAGNPVIHDPAAPSNSSVRRVYRRAEFEPLWLQNSGGTAYLIFPASTQGLRWPVAGRFGDFYARYDGLRLLGGALNPETIVNGHQAQYFEKARIEDHQGESNDPNWRFMYGLLVDELQQAQANLPIGGDRSSLSYKDLHLLADAARRAVPPAGYSGSGVWTNAGDGSVFIPFSADLRGANGHFVPANFWGYINNTTLFPGGWLHDVGLPISEVQTVMVTKNLAGGPVQRTIMVQAFQRTILTYDPANPPDWRIERANTGSDYQKAFPERVGP